MAATPFSFGNRLYAANFGLRRIESFDGAYQPILNGAFARPAEVPEDFAPFNFRSIGWKSEIEGHGDGRRTSAMKRRFGPEGHRYGSGNGEK